MKHNILKISIKCDSCDKLFDRRLDKIEKYKNNSKNQNLCKNCYTNFRRKERLDTTNPLAKEVVGYTTKYPQYSIDCSYCNKTFIVSYGLRHRVFCSKSCQLKGVDRITVKKKSKCVICSKEFGHYGYQLTCSEPCFSQYMSSIRIGENNPAFKKEKTIKKICLQCKIEFEYGRCGLHEGQERIFCSKKCSNEFQRGKSKDEVTKLTGGSGFFPEPNRYVLFHDGIKDKIRERDKNSCQLCGHKKLDNECNLPIHHIDYDTNNQEIDNLITLCNRCHNMTNHNKYFWETLFVCLKSNSKIVKKDWGFEGHIVNNDKYCLKFLIFWEGCQFSYHAHNEKSELFLCLQGKFVCKLGKNGIEENLLMKRGDKIQIEPGILHQLTAMRNSIILEVSTRDYKEDSYRIKEANNQI